MTAKALFVTILIFMSCKDIKEKKKEVSSIFLNEFETVITSDPSTIAVPGILKINSSLFVYDKSKAKLLRINERDSALKEIGRTGAGPGEYITVNNFFVRGEFLYVIDNVLMKINKYTLEGVFESNFNYGRFSKNSSAPPPPPSSSNRILANEIDNQPYVDLSGKVILPSSKFDSTGSKLFQIFDWSGVKISELGNIPKGSSFILDDDKIWNEVTEKKIPSYYKPNSFLVDDPSNKNEYFVIFSSIPKIVKYDINGIILWEKDTQDHESNVILNGFFEAMKKLNNGGNRNRIDLEFYSYGKANKEGELFLVLNKKPLTINQFDNHGKLLKRIIIDSKVNDVTQVLDFNFETEKIFIATIKGDIRSYPLVSNK